MDPDVTLYFGSGAKVKLGQSRFIATGQAGRSGQDTACIEMEGMGFTTAKRSSTTVTGAASSPYSVGVVQSRVLLKTFADNLDRSFIAVSPQPFRLFYGSAPNQKTASESVG